MFLCPKTNRKKKNIHVTDPGNGTRSDFRILERNPPLEKVILTHDNVHIDISGRFGWEKNRAVRISGSEMARPNDPGGCEAFGDDF